MEAGTVFFPQHAEWRDALESELFQFPNGAHDDIVDCLSHACAYVQRTAGPPVSGIHESLKQHRGEIEQAEANREAEANRPLTTRELDQQLREREQTAEFQEAAFASYEDDD